MTTNEMIKAGAKRLAVITILTTVIVWFGSELFYTARPDQEDRAPRQVELVIPEGTSDRVAQGEPVPTIPEEMVFMLGDVLVVRNRDTVDHQLGPLWIPAQTSAIMEMKQEENTRITCSFQPSNTIGLDVRPATTFWTRVQALLLAAPATAIFIFLYSFVLFPLDGKKNAGVKNGKQQLEPGKAAELTQEAERHV